MNSQTNGLLMLGALVMFALAGCRTTDAEADEDAGQRGGNETLDAGQTTETDSAAEGGIQIDQDRSSGADTANDESALADGDDFYPANMLAAKFVMSSVSQVPIVGEVTSQTILYVFFVVSPITPDEFELSQTICAIEQESDTNAVKIVFPDAFVNSLAALPRRLVLDRTGSNSGVRIQRSLELRGVELENPKDDPLPTSTDDPRVTDQDQDGRPGMTVRVRGLINGEIYVVQRTWDLGRGPWPAESSTGRIRGLIEWDQEQQILGADNKLLEKPNPTWVDPVAENSYFDLVPVDPSSGCSEILANKDSLFD